VSVAFDTSALMAIILLEPGADFALSYISEGRASAAILAETLGKLGLKGQNPALVMARFKAAGLTIDAFEEEDALAVAALHELHQRGVSLGDRFCLAHAMSRSLPIITADHPWRELGLPVELRFIR
jgi:PIN domain nuclease of toxin-antitoxin system